MVDRLGAQLRSKKDLRKSIRAEILTLTPMERAAQETRLTALFAALAGYSQARTVLLYAKAFPEELETRPYLKHALESGKRLACPRVDRRERRLRIFQIDDPDADLGPGTLDIPEPRVHCLEIEPSSIDWALVPGLAFDPECRRLGRGAGLYDRLLPQLRPDAPRWAVGFDCQIVDELPVEPHDVSLDGIATPTRLFSRRPEGSRQSGVISISGGSA
jgi:5-formyltetrahydrofolate cyclo-ligase